MDCGFFIQKSSLSVPVESMKLDVIIPEGNCRLVIILVNWIPPESIKIKAVEL